MLVDQAPLALVSLVQRPAGRAGRQEARAVPVLPEALEAPALRGQLEAVAPQPEHRKVCPLSINGVSVRSQQ